MSLWEDEAGKVSSSRAAFWLVLVVSLGLIIVEFFTRFTLSNGAYRFLVAALIATASWAGGRAVAQYVGPTLSGALSGLKARHSTKEDLP